MALFLLIYFQVFALLIYTWSTNREYSHCFLVPFFSAYLLWSNRAELRDAADQPAARGRIRVVLLLITALLLRFFGLAANSLTSGALSLVPLVMALATIKWGRPAVRLAKPAILFLIFMIPLPSFLADLLSTALQMIVTPVGTFALQTLGIPAISEETVISLTHGKMDVAEGYRGLYSFFAITVGACLIVDRTRIEKIIIATSAIPIGIAANSIAIVAAGVAFTYLDPATAGHIFVDVASWAMLPLGLLLLWGVFVILNRLFVREE